MGLILTTDVDVHTELTAPSGRAPSLRASAKCPACPGTGWSRPRPGQGRGVATSAPRSARPHPSGLCHVPTLRGPSGLWHPPCAHPVPTGGAFAKMTQLCAGRFQRARHLAGTRRWAEWETPASWEPVTVRGSARAEAGSDATLRTRREPSSNILSRENHRRSKDTSSCRRVSLCATTDSLLVPSGPGSAGTAYARQGKLVALTRHHLLGPTRPRVSPPGPASGPVGTLRSLVTRFSARRQGAPSFFPSARPLQAVPSHHTEASCCPGSAPVTADRYACEPQLPSSLVLSPRPLRISLFNF